MGASSWGTFPPLALSFCTWVGGTGLCDCPVALYMAWTHKIRSCSSSLANITVSPSLTALKKARPPSKPARKGRATSAALRKFRQGAVLRKQSLQLFFGPELGGAVYLTGHLWTAWPLSRARIVKEHFKADSCLPSAGGNAINRRVKHLPRKHLSLSSYWKINHHYHPCQPSSPVPLQQPLLLIPSPLSYSFVTLFTVKGSSPLRLLNRKCTHLGIWNNRNFWSMGLQGSLRPWASSKLWWSRCMGGWTEDHFGAAGDSLCLALRSL